LKNSGLELEKQRTRDSLTKAFFPIEWNDVEKKDGYQYALMRRFIFANDRDLILKARSDLGSVMRYYGVIADRNRLRRPGLNDGYKSIEFADNRTPNQDMLSRVKRVFQQRSPGLKHIYRKIIKKNPDNSFEGKNVLKLTIAADGTVKEFDENIRTAVSRWMFSKVKSGTTVVYVPIHFFEDDKTSFRLNK